MKILTKDLQEIFSKRENPIDCPIRQLLKYENYENVTNKLKCPSFLRLGVVRKICLLYIMSLYS